MAVIMTTISPTREVLYLQGSLRVLQFKVVYIWYGESEMYYMYVRISYVEFRVYGMRRKGNLPFTGPISNHGRMDPKWLALATAISMLYRQSVANVFPLRCCDSNMEKSLSLFRRVLIRYKLYGGAQSCSQNKCSGYFLWLSKNIANNVCVLKHKK